MTTRGAIVLVEVPYLDAAASARRPALVISNPTFGQATAKNGSKLAAPTSSPGQPNVQKVATSRHIR